MQLPLREEHFQGQKIPNTEDHRPVFLPGIRRE